MKYLLKNGYIVDGSGADGYIGNVLIQDDRIQKIFTTEVLVPDAIVIDCTNKVIAPGFIDAHSHQDWYVCGTNEREATECFIRQGVTTYVTGNCGDGIAGFPKDSPYINDIAGHLPGAQLTDKELTWRTYPEYFDFLEKRGLRQNMAVLCGHAMTAFSVLGGLPKERITPKRELDTIKGLLADAMDAGCKGMSFGLAYRPASFLTDKEMREIAQLAIDRNKVITVHGRVYKAYAPYLYGDDMKTPHNVRWLRDFLQLFRDSGAKMQYSHLIFSGRKAWESYDCMFEMFDEMIQNGGMDLGFDYYPYSQGTVDITPMMPASFFTYLKDHVDPWNNTEFIQCFEREVAKLYEKYGIEANDLGICAPGCKELEAYKGMRLGDMSQQRNVSFGQNLLDIYRLSRGSASLYSYVDQPEENIPKQMAHEKVLYMTDASISPGSPANPGLYGGMVRFIRIAREYQNMKLEEVITRMTGRSAIRFSLKDRGFLRAGYYADITVFDPIKVTDKATFEKPEQFAEGIEQVFINGNLILDQKKFYSDIFAGKILKD